MVTVSAPWTWRGAALQATSSPSESVIEVVSSQVDSSLRSELSSWLDLHSEKKSEPDANWTWNLGCLCPGPRSRYQARRHRVGRDTPMLRVRVSHTAPNRRPRHGTSAARAAGRAWRGGVRRQPSESVRQIPWLSSPAQFTDSVPMLRASWVPWLGTCSSGSVAHYRDCAAGHGPQLRDGPDGAVMRVA